MPAATPALSESTGEELGRDPSTEVKSSQALLTLDLSYCRALTELPAAVGALKALQTLCLQGCCAIPSCVVWQWTP